jgi:hypothetical protein
MQRRKKEAKRKQDEDPGKLRRVEDDRYRYEKVSIERKLQDGKKQI